MTNLLSADCKIEGSDSNGDEGSSCLGYDLSLQKVVSWIKHSVLHCKGKDIGVMFG